MEKKVTVLTPNGRRQNVKVTPNTTLLQILEEVCVKHGFDSDAYCLRHHNKDVGLTQMFRFSGLPNNCLLEMWEAEKKRVETHVDICVQLEDGSRQQGKFVPTDSLWHVLEQLSAEAATNYESPVVLYMRQEILGKERLSSTSLKSLGITAGRAMVRLLNKQPEELKTQANVYIAPTVKDTSVKDATAAPKATKTSAAGAGGFAITKELVQSLKQQDVSAAAADNAMEDIETTSSAAESGASNNNAAESLEREKPKYDWGSGTGRTMQSSNINAEEQEAAERAQKQAEMEVEPEVHIVGERSAIIYSLDATQKHIEELPDSFFDLTVSDLKMVLRDLKKIASGNEDVPLLTEKLRELEENKTMLNKIAQYKNCVIRIQFPDRYVLQGIFKPIDTCVNVMDFVRNFIIQPTVKFELFTIPPKTIPAMDKTLLELDFVPTAVLHFALADADAEQQSFLKPELLKKLTSAEGAIYAANKMRISQRKHAETNNNNANTTTAYESRSPGPSTGAIPKRPRNEDFKQTT